MAPTTKSKMQRNPLGSLFNSIYAPKNIEMKPPMMNAIPSIDVVLFMDMILNKLIIKFIFNLYPPKCTIEFVFNF